MYGLLLFGSDPRQLSDIQPYPPAGREADGDVVEVLEVRGDFPWTYDAANKLAVTDTSRIAQQATQEAELRQAGADLEAERPLLRAMLVQALQDLQSDSTDRQSDIAEADTDRIALQTVTTLAALIPHVRRSVLRQERQLQREAHEMQARVRILRTLAALAGIPTGA